jgi:hypothetical protein
MKTRGVLRAACENNHEIQLIDHRMQDRQRHASPSGARL